ncbi:MAG TPA: hypothetical protein DIW48_07560 [Sphaerochaeta sp.]|nr:hypothetical protein [Sphaerochaeta sp.]
MADYLLLRGDKVLENPISGRYKILEFFIVGARNVLPTVFIVGGFIKAAIIAKMLGVEMQIIFSFEDYWNYSVSDFFRILPYAFLAIIISMRYEIKEQDESISNSEPEPPSDRKKVALKIFLAIFLTVFIVSPFVFHFLRNGYFGNAYLIVFICILIAIPISVFLFKDKHHLRLSLILLLFITFNTSFEMREIMDGRDKVKYEIISSQQIPENYGYTLSTSKYHVYIDDGSVLLLPQERTEMMIIDVSDSYRHMDQDGQ